MRSRVVKLMGWTGVAALAFELLYLVVMNAVLSTGVIQRAASMNDAHVSVVMDWRRAWSPWPGRAYVRDFRMELEDPLLQFRLTAGQVSFDVAAFELLSRRFSASHVRAEGVVFEFVKKAERTARDERRLAGFPRFETTLLAPLTEPEVARMWTVQLEDLDAFLDELWILELRYRGLARVRGGFELTPLQRLAIDPTIVEFDGGMLSNGTHVLSSQFRAHAQVALSGIDLVDARGLALLHALSAQLTFASPLEDLSIAELYVPGLRLRGAGHVAVALQVASGRLLSGSTFEVEIPSVDAHLGEVHFSGTARAALSVSESHAPTAHATAGGSVRVPMPGTADAGVVSAQLSNFTADLTLADNDLAAPLAPRLSVVLGELVVSDSRPILAAATRLIPVLAPIVLGSGALVMSATAYVTPEYTLVRLKHATLGEAALEGSAIPGANGWNGAVAGHFGAIPLGLRLHDSTLVGEAFTPPTWLVSEYLKAGIKPE